MSLTLLFDEDKRLKITKRARIRQGESLADMLYILVPIEYSDMSLEDFTATLLYVDPANVAHVEEMVKSDEIYKESYIKYTVPITSEFTKMAGDVVAELTLTKANLETGESYVIHSAPITITVLTWEDYYKFVPATSLNAIDQRILQLDALAKEIESTSEVYDKARVVDLNLNGDLLQLKTNEGTTTGNGVSILVEYDDKDMNPGDGEIDLDSIDDVTENG